MFLKGVNVRMKNKKAKKSIIESIADTLELPASTFYSLSHIEILSNKEIYVEGYKGMLEYDQNTMRLLCDNLIIKITGDGLYIKCYTPDGVVISGQIISVEFSKP